MKRKLAIGILTGAIIFGGAGTFAFAQTNGEGDGTLNFGQMKPYIEKMHPNLSVKEQKEMFNTCHGEGGMMENINTESMNPEGMMNNF